MLAAALLGSGTLFLIEAGIGLFRPGAYSIVERSSREQAPWRLQAIGAPMFVWALFCLIAGFPLTDISHWTVAILGLAFLAKGSLLVFSPSSLHDTPQTITADGTRWRAKCFRRSMFGVLLLSWGVVLVSS